jgi:hypothetical protein
MSKDHKLRGGLHEKELSAEQREHKQENEQRKYETMDNRKTDGPNRPST